MLPDVPTINVRQNYNYNFQFFIAGPKTHENAPIFAGDGTDETCAMDVAVLIAFPCVFLIFNIVYWAAFHL